MWIATAIIIATIVLCAVVTFLWAASAIASAVLPALDDGDYIGDDDDQE